MAVLINTVVIDHREGEISSVCANSQNIITHQFNQYIHYMKLTWSYVNLVEWSVLIDRESLRAEHQRFWQ